MEIDAEKDEPTDFAARLSMLHKILLKNGIEASHRAGKYYDCAVKETDYKVGDQVMGWDKELASKEGNMVIKPWIGTFIMVEKLGGVGCELHSRIANKAARVYLNSLR